MQAAIVHEPLDLHPRNGPGLAPFRTLTQFMQVIYSVCVGFSGMAELSQSHRNKRGRPTKIQPERHQPSTLS